MIVDYKLIQADGNMALAAEVMRFAKDGWDVLGAPIITGTISMTTEMVDGEARAVNEIKTIYAQAIILREPESAELRRLRDIEMHVDRIVTELDNPCTDELGMVTFAHEELTKVLRGGQFERKR